MQQNHCCSDRYISSKRPDKKSDRPIEFEAAVLDVKSSVIIDHDDGELPEEEAVETEEFHDCTQEKLEKGHYNIVFVHPEFIVSSKYGRKLMQSKLYQENVCAVVIDKAHCILEW